MYFCPVINETQPQKHVIQKLRKRRSAGRVVIVYQEITHSKIPLFMIYFSNRGTWLTFTLTFPPPRVTTLTKNSPSKGDIRAKYGAIYDQTIQSIKPHHLEKAHARNIVMIFSHPLNFHFDSRVDFRPTNGLSSPVIIVPICVCVPVRACVCMADSLISGYLDH